MAKWVEPDDSMIESTLPEGPTRRASRGRKRGRSAADGQPVPSAGPSYAVPSRGRKPEHVICDDLGLCPDVEVKRLRDVARSRRAVRELRLLARAMKGVSHDRGANVHRDPGR